MSIQRGWSALVVGCLLTAACSGSPTAGSPSSPSAPGSTGTPTPVRSPSTSAEQTTEPAKSTPPPPDDWSQVLAVVRGSVVRLSLTQCNGQPIMGSGFVVGDDLVATAAHVVSGARTMSVQTDAGDIVAAAPVALDMRADTALLRTDQPLGAPAMRMSEQEPPQGSALAALGFPLGSYDLRIAQGIVSGLHSSIDYGEQQVDNVFTTDAATNGGNSGGPVINHAGVVVGLVSGGANWDSTDLDSRRPVEGINYIVPAPEFVTRLRQWRDQSTAPTDLCRQDTRAPAETDFVLKVSVSSTHPDAHDIAQILFSHGDGINKGSYASAWTLFTPAMRKELGSLDKWQRGLISSYWKALEVSDVVRTGDTATAKATLQTEQTAEQGPNGQTCSIWLMSYQLRLLEGQWLINLAETRAPPSAC